MYCLLLAVVERRHGHGAGGGVVLGSLPHPGELWLVSWPRAEHWLVQVPAWVWGAVAGEQQPDGGTTQNYACFSYAADYLVIDTNTANDAVNPLCQRD